MKSFVAVLAFVALAAADVSHIVRSPEADATIIGQDADVGPESFKYQYQTSNGISAQESGSLKSVNKDEPSIEVQGSNSYTAPDGTQIQLSYVANEFGFQPSGPHLPTPPPTQIIPEYILRAIKYIEDHPPQPEPIRRA